MGRIILEISAIFVALNVGYIMGYKACRNYIQDVIEDKLNKDN